MERYGMNIFDNDVYAGTMYADTITQCENLIKIELDIEDAVELFYTYNNKPVANYNGGYLIKTDSDGFCSLIKG